MVRKARAKTSSPMVTTVPITKARINLGALIQQVHLNKEYVILEKDGIPIAGIMDIDEFEDYLELQDPKVRAIIAKGRQEYLAGKSRPAEDLLHELQDRKGGKVRRRQQP
jgi:PHD/YefM family antitoxin component YafN of YafNO toxin-antitoxin module